MKMLLIKAVLFSLLFTSVSCQIFTPAQISSIEDFISDAIKCWKVPGLTLGVVKGNDTWTKGFGFADVENKKPVTSSTLFGIGSITKSFTSTLLSILIDESDKKYKWTSTISSILGEDFKLVDAIRSKDTTIRDILVHRTGLPSGDFGIFAGYPKNFTRRDGTRLLQYLDKSQSFRDIFMYNNWMYTLAGYIVEVLSGNTWEDELKLRILDPLGMSDTRVIGQTIEVTADNMAKPYVMVGDNLELSAPDVYKINPQEPAGAIASSAEDMVKWIQLHLNKGNMTDGRVVADWKTLNEVFQPYTTIMNKGWTKPSYPISNVISGYGYGWFIANHDGYRKVWHSGGLHGYTAMLWLFPDLDIGFYSNVNGPAVAAYGTRVFDTIMSYLFDIVMENEPWLNKSTACTFPSPWQTQPTFDSNTDDITNEPVNDVAQYVGEYGHRLLGEIQVTADGNYLNFKSGRFQGNLNTTKTADLFKLQATGDLGFMYHQEELFHAFPVAFERKRSDKFQDVVVEITQSQKYKFERGVKRGDSTDTGSVNASSEHKLFLGFALTTMVLYLFL